MAAHVHGRAPDSGRQVAMSAFLMEDKGVSVEILQIDELERLANERGATIYNIAHRNAGWGIQWHDPVRQKGDDWKSGIVIHTYYPTLAESVTEELKRLKGDDRKVESTGAVEPQ